MNSQVTEVRNRVGRLRVVPMDPTKLGLSKITGLTMGERKLTGQAPTDLCNIFKLQYGALAVGQKADDEVAKNWHKFSKAVAEFRSREKLVAVIDPESDTVERVLIPEKSDGDRINMDAQLDFIDAYLAENGGSTLRSIYFDIQKLTIAAQMIDEASSVKITGKDIWKTGIGLSLGQKNGWYSPAFLRLVCTNGMMAVENAAKHWLVGVKALTRRVLRLRDAELNSVVISNSRRLMRTAATVEELHSVRRYVNAEKFDRHFSVGRLDRAYAKIGALRTESVFDEGVKWRENAATDIPAYDVFNYATDQSSHNDNLETADKIALNACASKMFFDGPRLASIPPNPFTAH